MFSLFLIDMEMLLQENQDACITLDHITSIYLLIFADNAVLFSESKQGLQSSKKVKQNVELNCKFVDRCTVT